MQIKILYENLSINAKLIFGWGVSYLIDGHILFDAGEKFQPLFKNMKNMNINMTDLDTVVISHNHWDHTGGLWDILKRKKGIKVYICPGFGDEFKKRVEEFGGSIIEAGEITKVGTNIYTTGEISAEYKGLSMPEQSLVVKTDKGISVMTGCAHPGVVRILKKIRGAFLQDEFYLVFGGFHLMDKAEEEIGRIIEEFQRLGIKKAGPSHCSGDKAKELFRGRYKDDFIDVKVGMTVEV